MSSASKLLNLSAFCYPSLNERSECPGEGSVRSTGGEVTPREQRQQAVERAHSAPLAQRTSPHDLRSFPSPSQSLALLRERGTMQQRRLLFAHNKPLYTPRSTSKASARERGRCGAPGVRSFTVRSTDKPLCTPGSMSIASARKRGRCEAPGVRSFTVRSTSKLLNLSALCFPSLNERSECPEEGHNAATVLSTKFYDAGSQSTAVTPVWSRARNNTACLAP